MKECEICGDSLNRIKNREGFIVCVKCGCVVDDARIVAENKISDPDVSFDDGRIAYIDSYSDRTALPNPSVMMQILKHYPTSNLYFNRAHKTPELRSFIAMKDLIADMDVNKDRILNLFPQYYKKASRVLLKHYKRLSALGMAALIIEDMGFQCPEIKGRAKTNLYNYRRYVPRKLKQTPGQLELLDFKIRHKIKGNVEKRVQNWCDRIYSKHAIVVPFQIMYFILYGFSAKTEKDMSYVNSLNTKKYQLRKVINARA